jgi:hypothetical protein
MPPSPAPDRDLPSERTVLVGIVASLVACTGFIAALTPIVGFFISLGLFMIIFIIALACLVGRPSSVFNGPYDRGWFVGLGLVILGVGLIGIGLFQKVQEETAPITLVLSSELEISPSNPRVGQPVTATFSIIVPPYERSIALSDVSAAGRRFPDDVARQSDCQGVDHWGYPMDGYAGFPSYVGTTGHRPVIGPGASLNYKETLVFSHPGRYFAEVYALKGGRGSILPKGTSEEIRKCFWVSP